MGYRYREVGIVDARRSRFGCTLDGRRLRDLDGLCAVRKAVGHRG